MVRAIQETTNFHTSKVQLNSVILLNAAGVSHGSHMMYVLFDGQSIYPSEVLVKIKHGNKKQKYS